MYLASCKTLSRRQRVFAPPRSISRIVHVKVKHGGTPGVDWTRGLLLGAGELGSLLQRGVRRIVQQVKILHALLCLSIRSDRPACRWIGGSLTKEKVELFAVLKRV